jgi:hypothetical protein
VPYCVTTWGAATGKIAQAERQFRDQAPLTTSTGTDHER